MSIRDRFRRRRRRNAVSLIRELAGQGGKLRIEMERVQDDKSHRGSYQYVVRYETESLHAHSRGDGLLEALENVRNRALHAKEDKMDELEAGE